METLQIIVFIVIFLTMAAAMFTRKLPALLALPLMAFLIALIGGVSFKDILSLVVGKGVLRLHPAYVIAIFGSMLSVLMQKTKVAENLIKKGAELSGDNPWTIAVIFLALIALLFTSLGGLGAIIMVATIALPIMVSVGMGPLTVVGIFLFGLSMGGILNAGNWALYITVLDLEVVQIRTFALIMFAILFITSLFYITIQLYRDGHNLRFRKIIIYSLSFLVVVMGLFFLWNIVPEGLKDSISTVFSYIGKGLKLLILGTVILAVLSNILRIIRKQYDQ